MKHKFDDEYVFRLREGAQATEKEEMMEQKCSKINIKLFLFLPSYTILVSRFLLPLKEVNDWFEKG